jgi:hypothetical protein
LIRESRDEIHDVAEAIRRQIRRESDYDRFLANRVAGGERIAGQN